MTEDRSLDEFLPEARSVESGSKSADEKGDDEDVDDEDVDVEDVNDEYVDDEDVDDEDDGEQDQPVTVESEDSTPTEAGSDTVELAVSTSRWTKDGTHCDRCERTIQRLWREGEQFVCERCAEW